MVCDQTVNLLELFVNDLYHLKSRNRCNMFSTVSHMSDCATTFVINFRYFLF